MKFDIFRNPIRPKIINSNTLVEGDCLEMMPSIDDKSVDLILCDLPYGTTPKQKWDTVIDFEQLWSEYKRILKPCGVVVLTGHQLFTAKVICSNELMFKYKMVWVKSVATNFLNAKKQPLRKQFSKIENS